jgi:hypothetical protein
VKEKHKPRATLLPYKSPIHMFLNKVIRLEWMGIIMTIKINGGKNKVLKRFLYNVYFQKKYIRFLFQYRRKNLRKDGLMQGDFEEWVLD